MGAVHRGRDTLLDRDVAIKMMRESSRIDAEFKQRFHREARVCAQLQHPNIVAVYDMGEHEESSYIVMELLDGFDWRRIIRDKRRIPAPQKIEFIVQVCDGLAFAHRHSIFHRDLKPSNLFIHQDRQVKILDFGLARMPASSLTVTGRVLGTPNYMAPEQILGEKCDAQSDLFSAAIVFFEFLTGVHPFEAPFIPRRIAYGEPERLSNADPSLPGAFGEIFERAFANSPASRYRDAEEIASALRAVAKVDMQVSDSVKAPLPPFSSEQAKQA